MNGTIKKLTITITAIIIIYACGKQMGREPLDSDPSVPAAVSNVKVENRSGKAKLTYTVPYDKALLYVQAEYKLSNGEAATRKASYYEDSLILDGFSDTLEHEVSLYSISRGGIKSEPVLVKVKPLEASIYHVIKSLKIENAFGGFNISALNPTGENIGIVVLTKNVFKEYEADNNLSVFTNEKSILSKVRNMDTTTVRIGFFVKDRWGNVTDTVYKDITPIYEVQLSPANFKGVAMPNDAPQVTNGARLEYAWDGRYPWPYTSFTDQSKGGNGPHMVTIDMGVTAKLSRIWIRPWPEGTRFYYLSTMKRFEIYGSTNPTSDGSLDNSWTLLGSYEVVKPSGLPYGNDNALDQATASAGFNYEIALSAPKVRFLRIRCLENFAGGTAQSINEISMYGDPR
ncbi:MAG TPA: DUF5000 domain-containing lipoprotein [Niastella sp.]